MFPITGSISIDKWVLEAIMVVKWIYTFTMFLSVFSIQKSYQPPAAAQRYDPVLRPAADEDERTLHAPDDPVSRWLHPDHTQVFQQQSLW